jgi:hypothetical protein
METNLGGGDFKMSKSALTMLAHVVAPFIYIVSTPVMAQTECPKILTCIQQAVNAAALAQATASQAQQNNAMLASRVAALESQLKIEFQDYTTPTAVVSADHQFVFPFPVKHAWAETRGNIINARGVYVTWDGGPIVSAHMDLHGDTTPGGVGLLQIRVWAVPY